MNDLRSRYFVRSSASSCRPISCPAHARSLLTVVVLAAALPLCGWSSLNTTTGLSVSSGSVPVGTAVTLTATVTDQNSAPVTSGRVKFCDANATYCEDIFILGTAQLTWAGTATLTLRLGVGIHSVKAIFVGTNTDTGSVSSNQSVAVTGLMPTSTALTVSGWQDNYMLTATVSGAGAVPTGMVTFVDANAGNTTLATVGLDSQTAVIFPATSYGVGFAPSDVVVSDFNSDGKPDLVVSSDDGISLLLSNGDGSFQPQQQISSARGFPIAVSDFNGDGKHDLALLSLGGDGVYVLLGNGDGTFQLPQIYATGELPYQIAVGDFNGDGNPDVVTTNQNTVSVLLGNGDGSFQAPKTYSTGISSSSFVVGDFNHDGALDLALINVFDNNLSILLGNGDGTFQPPQTYAAGNGPTSIAAADVNGDGKLDLVVNGGVLLGNGDGTFQPPLACTGLAGNYSIAIGDFNGDGKPDLLGGSDSAVVLLGNGDGTFQAPQSYSIGIQPGPDSIGAVAAGDFNGDGRWDMLAANLSNTVNVLLNGWSVQATASNLHVLGDPNSHEVFASYSGDSSHGSSNSKTVSLAFTSLLTVWVGSDGTVQAADRNINCPANCAYPYPSGSVLDLTATPDQVGSLAIWQGCDWVAGNVCTVAMTTPRNVFVAFAPLQSAYTLNVFAIGNGTGTVSSSDGGITNCGDFCFAAYAPWTSVILTATPAQGSTFSGWTGCDLVDGNTCSVTVRSWQIVAATFANSSSSLRLVPVAPCRIADTRNPNSTFGGPSIVGETSRYFPIPQSSCGIPATAAAYSLNFTVVPHGPLGYLTVWPTGLSQPVVSTLNSYDGRIKANAAIVPAGSGGAIGAFATDTTDLIIDINGYFVSDPSQLAFYPLAPCRVLDTRNATDPLGGPSMAGGQLRDFPVQSSACGIPSTALAYSLNFTAVPQQTLGYLTVWPSGASRPVVSTLNSPTGTATANAAIVPAGTGGDISAFVTDNTDLIADINGYFAPPGTGGQSLYVAAPCRVLDTRNSSEAFQGELTVAATGAPCMIPANAQASVFNATVVPQGPLGYLTLWPDGSSQPVVSTLNALDGAITSNMAIVPTLNGFIDAFATKKTDLILDVFSYFAP
jgi:hypothetical protein